MFTGNRRIKPDLEWIGQGIALVYHNGRVFRLEQLPNTDWKLSHPSIGQNVFRKCGYPVALAFLANR